MVVDVVVFQHAVPVVIEIDTDLQEREEKKSKHTIMTLTSQFGRGDGAAKPQ